MIKEISESHTLAENMERIAKNLQWCLSERFSTRDGEDYVLRGRRECVSLYCSPDADQAIALAEDLERIVGPVRRVNAIRMLNEIDALSTAARKAVLYGA